MSFILDALKRAEAERARGAVPGLMSQPLPGPLPSTGAVRRPGLPWALAGLLLAAALLAAALLGWRSAPSSGAPSVTPADGRAIGPTVASSAPIGAGATPAPSPMPRPAPPPAARPTPPTTAAVAARSPAAPAMTPAPAPTQPSSAATRPPTPEIAPAPGSVPMGPVAEAPGPRPSPATPAAAAADPAPPPLAALPAALRQQVPPLALNGWVYSPQRGQRMLVLNGQVFHEGDSPAAGVRVERIGPASAVLSVQGQPWTLPY